MRWTWEPSKVAERQIERLDKPIRRRVLDALDGLATAFAEERQPANVTKLVGFDDVFRLRVGDYRVIFHAEERQAESTGGQEAGEAEAVIGVVVVERVGHRGEVYDRR